MNRERKAWLSSFRKRMLNFDPIKEQEIEMLEAIEEGNREKERREKDVQFEAELKQYKLDRGIL